jgi:hypothetical protein
MHLFPICNNLREQTAAVPRTKDEAVLLRTDFIGSLHGETDDRFAERYGDAAYGEDAAGDGGG